MCVKWDVKPLHYYCYYYYYSHSAQILGLCQQSLDKLYKLRLNVGRAICVGFRTPKFVEGRVARLS